MATSQRDGRATVTVGPRELAQARQLSDFLEDRAATTVTVSSPDDRDMAVPPELTGLLLELVDLVSRGYTVTLGAVPAEVTTTVAASMLDISRPSLMKLVRERKIPAHKVGSHTRLAGKDVLAFRRARLEAQSAAFAELRELEQEWNVLD